MSSGVVTQHALESESFTEAQRISRHIITTYLMENKVTVNVRILFKTCGLEESSKEIWMMTLEVMFKWKTEVQNNMFTGSAGRHD